MTDQSKITGTTVPHRSNFSYRGIRLGHLGPVVLRLPWPVQDALEARCAKTGETMAEALVAIAAEKLA